MIPPLLYFCKIKPEGIKLKGEFFMKKITFVATLLLLSFTLFSTVSCANGTSGGGSDSSETSSSSSETSSSSGGSSGGSSTGSSSGNTYTTVAGGTYRWTSPAGISSESITFNSNGTYTTGGVTGNWTLSGTTIDMSGGEGTLTAEANSSFTQITYLGKTYKRQ